jgi:glycosyltransferase involved in cell wall biosynthesis
MKRLWVLMFVVAGNVCANPRVSIITSVFKGDVYIADFMREIVKQTMFDQCELLLINANSPGNEEPVILPYLNQYPNIIYTKLEKDPGLYAVWNKGIQSARGEYIINANLDDGLAYDALEKYVKVLDENPGIDLVYPDLYLTYKPMKSFYDANTWNARIVCMPEFSPEALAKRCLPNCHPMWRKSMHEKYGYFDESYKSAGDYEMWIRAVQNGAQFKRVPKILGFYYFNPKGLSTKKDTPEELELLKIKDRYADFFVGSQVGFFESWYGRFLSWYHRLRLWIFNEFSSAKVC